MDNPQHYQPLSHALQPPVSQPSQYPSFPTPTTAQPYSVTDTQREEEEEEEEEVVEEELDDNDRGDLSPSASPQNKQIVGPAASGNPTPQERPPQIASAGQSSTHGPDSHEQKRRPGRPKGSRNRKPRETAGSVGKSQFPSYPISQGGAPPLPGVTAQNQQYYEFQWRVLNLCSEFYGAAEELLKATPSLVIAQSKVDPLSMLNEAKRICDSWCLVGQPPPTIYPSVTYPPAPQPAASTPAASTSQPSAVITNPSTFVMPLGMPNASQPIYPTMYGTTPPRYPTAPYYQYPHAPGYYPTIPAQSTPAPPATPSSAPPPTQFVSSSTAATSTLTMTTSNPTGASVHGQMRKHQILLKATSLGLKESTTRGVKRRREGEPPSGPESAPAPPMTPHQCGGACTLSCAKPGYHFYPFHSAVASNPQPSPPPQPQSSTSTPTPTPSRPTTAAPPPNMPWPMPTVAAHTSPVIAAAATAPTQPDQRNANFYRPPRPHPQAAPVKAVPSTSHQYMYQPNGKSSK
ncbi:hypothetical protein BGW80DRAFT_1437670 [Lactifluus volemus]|nr:hypothetical protein BGW80DRAFT_1437670 [Lactifluus volemus]